MGNRYGPWLIVKRTAKGGISLDSEAGLFGSCIRYSSDLMPTSEMTSSPRHRDIQHTEHGVHNQNDFWSRNEESRILLAEKCGKTSFQITTQTCGKKYSRPWFTICWVFDSGKVTDAVLYWGCYAPSFLLACQQLIFVEIGAPRSGNAHFASGTTCNSLAGGCVRWG